MLGTGMPELVTEGAEEPAEDAAEATDDAATSLAVGTTPAGPISSLPLITAPISGRQDG